MSETCFYALKDADICVTGEGIDAFFPIVRGVCTLEEAMLRENARKNVINSAEQVFRLLALYLKE